MLVKLNQHSVARLKLAAYLPKRWHVEEISTLAHLQISTL